jgi:hypothetical protein
MPGFEVDRADRRRAEIIVAFVKESLSSISVEGRFVLAIELMRLLKPEIDELKRRQGIAARSGNSEPGEG